MLLLIFEDISDHTTDIIQQKRNLQIYVKS